MAKELANVNQLLSRYKDQIAAALPRHITADRMMRLTMTSIRKNPKLEECDTTSLFGAIITACQLGLEPGITAHLVPFKNNKAGRMEVQFIPDYRGLVELARRSGAVSDVDADIVCANDIFDYQHGSERYLHHKRPPLGKDRGGMTGVWAMAYFTGDVQPRFKIMDVAEVEKIKERSKAKAAGPWVTDFEAMAVKTCVKQLCKLLPQSVELAQALRTDDEHEIGAAQENWIIAEDPEPAAIKAPRKKKAEETASPEWEWDPKTEKRILKPKKVSGTGAEPSGQASPAPDPNAKPLVQHQAPSSDDMQSTDPDVVGFNEEYDKATGEVTGKREFF